MKLKLEEPELIPHEVFTFKLPSQAEICYRQCQDKICSAKNAWRDKKGLVVISGCDVTIPDWMEVAIYWPDVIDRKPINL